MSEQENDEQIVDAEVVGDGAQNQGDEGAVVDAEVVEEEPIDEADTDDGSEQVESDLDQLAAATRERDEYLELARRARADFENYKRRVGGETVAAERRGRANLARGLLPALDNLERALVAAGVDPTGQPESVGEPPSREVSARDALAEGVALVLREMRGALERSGVRSFDPLGEQFDPLLHEAISTGQVEGAASGSVIETLERGYRVDDEVIRPARVVVAG